MTSLVVLKNPKDNTYDHFYTGLIKQSNWSDENNISTKQLVVTFVKIITYSLVITCCTYVFVYGWKHLLSDHYNSIYYKYEFWYLFDCINWVICPFLSLIYMNHIFMNAYYNYSLKHNMIITFIATVVINGTIVSLLLFWQQYEYNNDIWYVRVICKNVLTHVEAFRDSCKFRFSIIGLYLFPFGYTFNMLLTIILNYSIFLLLRKLRKSTKNATKQAIEAQEDVYYELSVITTTPMINNLSTTMNLDIDINLKQKLKHSFGLYIMFTLLLCIYLCEMLVVEEILYYYTKNLNYYFYVLLFSSSLSKILLKLVARNIDVINMNCEYNLYISKKWYHYVCMELLIELSINLVYFTNYYLLFLYELSSINTYHVFLIIFYHLLSESCQSIIRFSSLYFHITKKIYSKIEYYYYNYNDINDHEDDDDDQDDTIDTNNKYKHKHSYMYKLLSLILYIFEDNSNVDEWRIRHSIDASIRFISLICAFVAFVIEIIISPRKYFDAQNVNKSDYFNGILYCCLSFFCDLIYFAFLFLYNYCCNDYFIICKPLIFMYRANTKMWICLFALSILFTFAFG